MQLFVGLGNPESKYAKNRHNVGFMAIDALAAAYGFGDFREKYHGLLAEGQIGTQKVLLLKPQTFMNKSLSRSPVASFTPIMFFNSNSLAIVSTDISITDLPGML